MHHTLTISSIQLLGVTLSTFLIIVKYWASLQMQSTVADEHLKRLIVS